MPVFVGHNVYHFSFCTAIISQEEFIEGALDDEWIREMLACDPNTVKVKRPFKGSSGSKALGSSEPTE